MASSSSPSGGGSAPLNPHHHDDLLNTLLVHVVAPAALPEGYTFEAEINGDPDKMVTIEVPAGGVREGEGLWVPLPPTYNSPRLKAPLGYWKDGLCDFCSHGLCHASLWCSILCTQIAMGQIMTRAQLTWLGTPGPVERTKKTFGVVVVLSVAYFVYSYALELAATPYGAYNTPPLLVALKWVGVLSFSVWMVMALSKTRQNIRRTYSIPEQTCMGCEDLCCALWCGCCATAQMMRHTGEYETYPGTCCTKTGHPPGTPVVV